MMQCTATKTDGQPCRATALPGKEHCVFHDPDSAGRRKAARSAGGRARLRPRATLPPDTPDVPLASVADVVALLGVTANQVRTGKIDCKVGSTVAYICNALVAAM